MRQRWPKIAALISVLVLLQCGANQADRGQAVAVSKQDLVCEVEVTGTLRSLEFEAIGPAASVIDIWDFKIIRMAPEGARVKVGSEVLAFDPSDLEKKRDDYASEVAGLHEEMGKMQAEASLNSLKDRMDLEDAKTKYRVAELKADKPADLTARSALQLSSIDRDLAEHEVAFRKERELAKQRLASSDLAILNTRLLRMQRHIEELKSEIAAMSVKARREGTVVYKQDGQGDKKKIGDTLGRSGMVLEIASLSRMAAQGQVDEVDASSIALGQRVGLRLEAYPDREYIGVVARVANLVQTESAESRIKVVQLDINLTEIDSLLMRPGMRFRGHIEVARLADVVQIPLAAIQSTARGPVVQKRTLGGTWSVQPVQLGRRSRDAVQIRAGLKLGEQVLLPAPEASTGGQKSGAMHLGGA